MGYLLCVNKSKKLINEFFDLTNDLKKFQIDVRKSIPYLLMGAKVTVSEAQGVLLEGLKGRNRVVVRSSVCAIRHWIALRKLNLLDQDCTVLVQALVSKLIYRAGVGLSSTMRELALIIFEFSDMLSDIQIESICSSLNAWEEVTRIEQNPFSSLDPLYDSNEVLRTRLAMLVAAISLSSKILGRGEDIKWMIEKLINDPLPEVRNSMKDWLKFEIKDVVLNR